MVPLSRNHCFSQLCLCFVVVFTYPYPSMPCHATRQLLHAKSLTLSLNLLLLVVILHSCTFCRQKYPCMEPEFQEYKHKLFLLQNERGSIRYPPPPFLFPKLPWDAGSNTQIIALAYNCHNT